MLFLRFSVLFLTPFPSSTSSILLPSEGIAVVLLLRASVLLCLDKGFNRLLSSTSDMSEEGSGVHVS